MCPSTKASLNEWLRYIEAIHPQEIELGLSRLKCVADRLLSSTPPNPFVFTVAGTNGKGTTTAALNALGLAAGKKVGWYSSPHLFKFNERIRLNDQCVSDQSLVEALVQVEEARKDVSLSYFEYTTLAAFRLFEQANLDIWVLEIGLGGRLDAVNIIEPDVAVITNIGLDHQGFLGSDLQSIGREKAGICRKGKPVVLGSSVLPESVLHMIDEVSANAYSYGQSHSVDGKTLNWGRDSMPAEGIRIPLVNATSALQAFSLSPFSISSETALAALKSINMKGRLQKVISNNREIILDVGHNPHAAEYISQQLSGTKFHLILGMLADKDVTGVVDALSDIALSVNFVSLNVPRGLSSEELQSRAGNDQSRAFASIASVIEFLDRESPLEPLFIGGSFYTVCDALACLES